MSRWEDEFSGDILKCMAARMAEELQSRTYESMVARACTFSFDRAWEAVERDLDEAFLRSIGIQP